jgi:hypothetical protein
MTRPFLPTTPAGVRTVDPAAFAATPKVAAHPFAADMTQVVDGCYTLGELHAAMEAIQDRDNWKNPIRCAIPAGRLDVASKAAAFFTGAPLTVEAVTADRMAVVSAPGYYATIGA